MYERFRKEKIDLALKFVKFTKKQERSQIKQRNHEEAKIQGLRNQTTTSFLDFSRLEHAQATHEHREQPTTQ